MATAKELALVYTLTNEGTTEYGYPSFLKSWTPVRFLGKGNFGEVFEIKRGGERCALKIVEMDDSFIDMYAVEIDTLSRIRGERHAVRIEEYEIIGVDKGAYTQRYMIIRMNLLEKLPQFMDEDSVIKLGLDMCDILAKCHSGSPKILHCDIKPENILVSPDGSFLLSDFGAAKVSDKTHNSSGFRGTPMYMSPEMHNYKGYDNRTDLYSLGVTMYTLLNGRLPPFSNGTNNEQAIHMRLNGAKLPDIPGVTAAMMKILRKLCAVDPNKRYKTAQELAADLTALADARDKAARREARKNEIKQRKTSIKQSRRDKKQAFANTRAGKETAVSGDIAEDDETVIPGKKPVPPSAKRTRGKPLGVILTAAAVAAAVACWAVFMPGLSFKKETERFPGIAVGEHVSFGSYPQTQYGEVQPIEWRVLDIEDGKALLISEYLLDCKKYNEIYIGVKWETCGLREWLNGDFYSTAFSEEEQGIILAGTSGNPGSSANGGKERDAVEDKVFCLSADEVQKYFSESPEEQNGFTSYPGRMAAPTAYAVKNGAYIDPARGTGWWWLRSSGSYSNNAAYVNLAGCLDEAGLYVNSVNGCVRPVIVVSLKA